MIPRTLLTALLLSTVAVGSVTTSASPATPTATRGGGLATAESGLGADPAVAGLTGWLRSRPLLGGLVFAGAAAVGLVLVRAGYRRARARYRAYTSPTVVLLDDDLGELEWDVAESTAPDQDDPETDDGEP